MRTGGFTSKERAYLLSLPAVEAVTQGRIFYSEEFKVECMRRYHEGMSPARIFSEAGLYPALIGYKRIERCVARWRASEKAGRLGIGVPKGVDVPRFVSGPEPDRQRVPGWNVSRQPTPGRNSPRPVQDVSGLVLMRYEGRLRTLERRLYVMNERLKRLEGLLDSD